MDIVTTLSAKVNGLLYISESENPFAVHDWGQLPANEVPQRIIKESVGTTGEDVKKIATDDFFAKLTRVADPEDSVMVSNAQKAEELQQYLNDTLTDVSVYRIEGSTQVPIFITGFQPDGSCLVLQTLAVET